MFTEFGVALHASAGRAHEPARHPEHARLVANGEAEALVEADVLRFVGLEVQQPLALIHPGTDLGHDLLPDALTLQVRGHRQRAEVPVRVAVIARRPRAGPAEHAPERRERVSAHEGGHDRDLLAERGLARGPCRCRRTRAR